MFVVTLFAEFVANDRPLLIRYDGHWFVPVLQDYAEDAFGPDFLPLEADYTDPDLARSINARGWMLWPALPFSYDTLVKGLPSSPPTPPSLRDPLGTDDQSRDVLARVIYGFRISVLFGFTLTIISSVIGIAAGAVQGYYGGLVDLLFQRFIEIWSGMPQLFMLIILGSVIAPGFWVLLVFMLLFSWMALTGVVRAEFLRGRNLDYVRAARAPGCAGWRDHAAAHPAERAGGDVDVPALHPVRLGDVAGEPGFPRLRVAAGLALARGVGQPGQEQPAGAVARDHRVRRAGRHPGAADLHRRGGARRLRPSAATTVSLLEVDRLSIRFGAVAVVDQVSFSLNRGETVALVGESGSGKSLTALSILRLLPPGAQTAGRITLDGSDMLTASDDALRKIRGRAAGMIFQEPMTSLNPLHRIGRQVGRRCICMAAAPAGRRSRRCCNPAASRPRTGWTRCRTSFRAGSGSG